jgi:hypothetical protein
MHLNLPPETQCGWKSSLPPLLLLRRLLRKEQRTVLVFRQEFTRADAIGSHASSLEANMRMTNGIPLGYSLLLPVGTVNPS